MARTEIYDGDGETTIAIDLSPDEVRRTPPDVLVHRHLERIVRACREIGARPIAGQSPLLLSERELRRTQPDAVLARPGRVWLAVPVRRDRGESRVEIRDLSHD